MSSLWNEYGNARNFPILSKSDQDRLITLLLTKEVVRYYYSDVIINIIRPHLDNKTFIDIAYNFINNGKAYSMKSNNTYEIFNAMYNIDPTGSKVAIMNSKIPALNKLILMCNDLTIEEEIKGLRALSTSKYIPSKIYKLRYKPRLKALIKLPPIMRLKTIEALINSRKLKYNIFENIPNDKFKALLFTPALNLKYSDKVETIYNKYDEIKYMGIESTVKVSGQCDLCGDYSITIKSNVIRTSTGMRATNLGRLAINKVYCPFCYTKLKQEPVFEGQVDEKRDS